jgi:hypothetical protein
MLGFVTKNSNKMMGKLVNICTNWRLCHCRLNGLSACKAAVYLFLIKYFEKKLIKIKIDHENYLFCNR